MLFLIFLQCSTEPALESKLLKASIYKLLISVEELISEAKRVFLKCLSENVL